MYFRLAAAGLIALAGAWAFLATGTRAVVVRLVEPPGPVAAVRPAAVGAAVDLRDGRRVGLALVAGRPVFGPVVDPVPTEVGKGWDEILRLASHNDGRLDPIAVRDVDGDRVEDWVALETAGTEARLLVLHRRPTGPVTVAFLDGVAGRFDDGGLPVGLVDTEGTGRPDLLVATADRRQLLRVRLWPGRLEIEERIALVGQVATPIVPLGPGAVAAGLADGKIATIAWPGR